MPPEIQELMQQAEMLMQYIASNAGTLNLETQKALASFLQETQGFIEEYSQTASAREPFQGQVEPTVNETPPPGSQQLLWILSGQNPEVFTQYLQTYPDPSFQALLNNPTELNRTIEFLHAMMPSGGEPPSVDGIQHADLNSSNIYGFKYDPKSRKLLVKFQGGGLYGYYGVPPEIYKTFANGAVPAKTSGQNAYGKWWIGKNPSLGAAFYSLIRNGGYQYNKLN